MLFFLSFSSTLPFWGVFHTRDLHHNGSHCDAGDHGSTHHNDSTHYHHRTCHKETDREKDPTCFCGGICFSKRKSESLKMQFWSRKKHFRLWNWFLKYAHEFCSYTYIGYFINFQSSDNWLVKKHHFIITSNDGKRFKLFPDHTNNLSFCMDTMYFMI